MVWYAVAALDDAFDAAKGLLTPLDAGQWLRLALVIFFVGSVGGGPSATVGSSRPGPAVGVPDVTSGPVGSFVPDAPADLLVFAVVAVGVGVAVGLAYALVGSVMEFVFVESLRRRRVRVRQYADQHLSQALGLFAFRVALGLAVAVPVVGGVLAVVASASAVPEVSLGLLVVLVPLVLLLGIGVAAVDAFTTGFVVPVMVRTNLGVLAAWRQFWPTLTREWEQYGVYLLVRVGLGLAVGVLASVVGGVLGAVVAAPVVVFGVVVLPAVGGPAALVANPFALAASVLVALAYLVILTAAVAVAFVPIRTYIRYHALLVLGDTQPEFDLIPELRQTIRQQR